MKKMMADALWAAERIKHQTSSVSGIRLSLKRNVINRSSHNMCYVAFSTSCVLYDTYQNSVLNSFCVVSHAFCDTISACSSY